MSLSVSNRNLPDLLAPKPQTANPPQTPPEAAQAATSSASDVGVSVVITASARSLSKDALSNAPEVDAKKVATMKAAIQDGSFSVNPEAIADKLLGNAQDMLRTTLR